MIADADMRDARANNFIRLISEYYCDCVSCKMAEFSFARRAFTVFLCDIFTGLES